MSFTAGDHVWANFSDARVPAIVLEIKGGEAKVQERDTRRSEWAEWIDISHLEH